MTFPEAVRSGFSKYANFNGRASRPEFWWWILFIFLGSLILSIFSEMLSGLFSLATLLPSIAVTARRLHDTDRSGWWQLIGFIPLIGLIIMIIWCVQEPKEPNRFG